MISYWATFPRATGYRVHLATAGQQRPGISYNLHHCAGDNSKYLSHIIRVNKLTLLGYHY